MLSSIFKKFKPQILIIFSLVIFGIFGFTLFLYAGIDSSEICFNPPYPDCYLVETTVNTWFDPDHGDDFYPGNFIQFTTNFRVTISGIAQTWRANGDFKQTKYIGLKGDGNEFILYELSYCPSFNDYFTDVNQNVQVPLSWQNAPSHGVYAAVAFFFDVRFPLSGPVWNPFHDFTFAEHIDILEAAPACSCDGWVDVGCDGPGCLATEKRWIRNCNPPGCDSELMCNPDPSCAAPPGACDESYPNNTLRVCYYDGINLTANPYITEQMEGGIPSPAGTWTAFDHDWGIGNIDATGDSGTVSGVWRGRINFEDGDYKFYVDTDDGVRLYVDGVLRLNEWRDQSASFETGLIHLSGFKQIRLEWYEAEGGARIKLRWEKQETGSMVINWNCNEATGFLRAHFSWDSAGPGVVYGPFIYLAGTEVFTHANFTTDTFDTTAVMTEEVFYDFKIFLGAPSDTTWAEALNQFAPPCSASSPTCTTSLSPTSITEGESAVFTWSSTNATDCYISGDDGWASAETSGSHATASTLSPGTYNFSGTCSGMGGSTTCPTRTLTITVLNQPPRVDSPSSSLDMACPPSPSTTSFSWTYNDNDGDPETRFDFRVNDVNNVNDPDENCGNCEVNRSFNGTLNNPAGFPHEQTVEIVESPQADKIVFATRYYWWVRVWDQPGDNSGWVYGGLVDTPSSPPPDPSFECSYDSTPKVWQDCEIEFGPVIGETIHFRNPNAGYDSYKWDFDYDGSFNSTPPHESEVEYTFTKAGTYTVMHQVRDDGLTCEESQTFKVFQQLPEWREIPPT